MNRWLVLVFLLGGTANADNIALSDQSISLPDFGTVTIGDSAATASRELRQPIAMAPGTNPESSTCMIFTPKGLESTGVSLIFEDKRITRINIDYYGDAAEPLSIKTAAGVGLGTTEEDVKKAYAGHFRLEPDSGDPTWHYIYVDAPGGETGLRFDTDGKKVKSMHAGQYPALNYKQGCY